MNISNRTSVLTNERDAITYPDVENVTDMEYPELDAECIEELNKIECSMRPRSTTQQVNMYVSKLKSFLRQENFKTI